MFNPRAPLSAVLLGLIPGLFERLIEPGERANAAGRGETSAISSATPRRDAANQLDLPPR